MFAVYLNISEKEKNVSEDGELTNNSFLKIVYKKLL